MSDVNELESSPILPGESGRRFLDSLDAYINNICRELDLTPPGAQRNSREVATPPQSSPLALPRQNQQDSAEVHSIPETEEEDNSLSDRSAVSPLNRRALSDRDAALARITSICDNVHQTLRSIGLVIGSDSGEVETTMPLESSATARAPSRTASSRSTLPATIADAVDLSRTPTLTPAPIRRRREPARESIQFDTDDDEVIVVSSQMPVIIDLCTPGHESNRRAAIPRRRASRRTMDESVVEVQAEPVRSRRRRLETDYANSSTDGNILEPDKEGDSSENEAPDNGDGGAAPFTCAVCMESCLKRKPTSTKCGHVFCQRCIHHAIQLTHKCPLCNTKLSTRQLIRIYV